MRLRRPSRGSMARSGHREISQQPSAAAGRVPHSVWLDREESPAPRAVPSVRVLRPEDHRGLDVLSVRLGETLSFWNPCVLQSAGA